MESLRILTALEDLLGSLGPQINIILSKGDKDFIYLDSIKNMNGLPVMLVNVNCLIGNV